MNFYDYEAEDAGFEILDFPCNQFGNQAPGTTEEIASFCDAKFGITFKLFSKIEVNGENTHPLYKYLKEQKGFGGFDPNHPLIKSNCCQHYFHLHVPFFSSNENSVTLQFGTPNAAYSSFVMSLKYDCTTRAIPLCATSI